MSKAATWFLVAAHVGLVVVGVFVITMMTMTTDQCEFVRCGNPQWMNAGAILGALGGPVLLGVDLMWLKHRGFTAWTVPLLCIMLQLAVFTAAVVMQKQAGPV